MIACPIIIFFSTSDNSFKTTHFERRYKETISVKAYNLRRGLMIMSSKTHALCSKRDHFITPENVQNGAETKETINDRARLVETIYIIKISTKEGVQELAYAAMNTLLFHIVAHPPLFLPISQPPSPKTHHYDQLHNGKAVGVDSTNMHFDFYTNARSLSRCVLRRTMPLSRSFACSHPIAIKQ